MVGMDLLGTSEIAELLGISRQMVHRLTRRDDFPAPTAELAIGKVWRRADVEAWARKTGRLG